MLQTEDIGCRIQHICLFAAPKLTKNRQRRSAAAFLFPAFVCIQMCHLFLIDLLRNILKGFRVSSYRVRLASVNISA